MEDQKASTPIDNDPRCVNSHASFDWPRVTKERIERLMKESSFKEGRTGAKTAFVTMTMANGFEITETSACVHPFNYDQAIGSKICRERIADRLWELEGYALSVEMHRRVELERRHKDGQEARIALDVAGPLPTK